MALAPRPSLPLGTGGAADAPAQALARRLAAAGLGVLVSRRRDTCELAIVGAAGGKSFVALDSGGQARWYYEPAAGPSTSPVTLTGIIAYLLEAPQGPASPAAYRGLPLKGQVGRSLQDRGLTVTLRVSEDLESFEATTDIDITSPARPWLGTVTVSDDAALDWRCDLQAAFGGNPAALVDTITPILRGR
jgi:hypothetical protein